MPWFEGYLVSQDGDVYSLRSQKFLKGYINRSSKKKRLSYVYFSLMRNGEEHRVRSNILVATTYIGHIAPGYEVHHKNGNSHDNNVENLEIILGKEHRRRGMAAWYVRNFVPGMRNDLRNGMSPEEIRSKYFVSSMETLNFILSQSQVDLCRFVLTGK